MVEEVGKNKYCKCCVKKTCISTVFFVAMRRTGVMRFGNGSRRAALAELVELAAARMAERATA